MRGGHICLFGDAISVHVQRWASELLWRGWQVSLITARPHPIEGVRQIVLTPVRRSIDWPARISEARRAVEALKPDLVHAHYITSYGFLAACCDYQPLVMTAWGSDLLVTPRRNWFIRRLTAWVLERSRLLTGDSHDLLDAALRLCPGAHVALIHWGVDLSRFTPVPWAEKTGFEVASLRNWEPNYRIDTIIDALISVRARFPGVPIRLHLLGSGSQESALRDQTHRLGLDAVVRFHGHLDDAGMAAVLRNCKLSISVPESDATSVSVLESMACGLAVIASDLPANRQWLNPELLVPSGQPQAIADTWAKLVVNDARTASLAVENAERMRLEGDRRTQMDAMDRLYRNLLA